ncbi:hypothetical protein ACWEOG_35450 [Amycolatopsis japonica]
MADTCDQADDTRVQADGSAPGHGHACVVRLSTRAVLCTYWYGLGAQGAA